MTWQDLIIKLSNELRDKAAWPSDSSKLDLQLAACYRSVIDRAKVTPIMTMAGQLSPSLTVTQTGDVNVASMPDDLFTERHDAGIKQLTFDDSLIYLPSQGVPLWNMVASAGNQFQASNVLFGISKEDGVVRFTGAQSLRIIYVPRPSVPNQSNYDSLEVPMTQNDIDAVIMSIAAHISAIDERDPAISTTFLEFSRMYQNE